MKTVEQLIFESERVLERNNQGVRGVGNRPHSPMLAIYNEAFAPTHIQHILAKLERIWPQAEQAVACFRYAAHGQKLSFADAQSGAVVTDTDVMNTLDNVKKTRDIFASMRHWRVYNVIDTTVFDSVEAFAAHYTAIGTLQNIVVDACKTMLIVLLDDSTAHRDTADAIRRYLAENNTYDATVIISNRTRNNEMYDMEELYRIVADVMILSNNDAVSALDDEDFKHRLAVLYNHATFTVSYVLKERPNHKIAVQIDHTILTNLLARLDKAPLTDVMAWGKALGFRDGASEHCEDFLKQCRFRIDPTSFEHLPMRATVLNETLDLSRMTYAQFKQFTYSDVLTSFAQSYCSKALLDDVDITPCVDAFRRHVLNTVDAADLAALTNDTIDRLMALLTTSSVSENVGLADYFEKCVHAVLRTDCLYPALRRVLCDLRRDATEALDIFRDLRHEFERRLPMGLEQTLGTVYVNAVANYLADETGVQTLHTVCRPGNSKADMLDAIFDTFTAIVDKNRELFSLSFIEEWERRLGMTGDRIYREISTALTDGMDEMIRLYGNAPTDYRLKVYMLHTTDAVGEHPTDLYTHLQTTFREDPFVQYFNTGYDDALEAISFVACEGTKLLL